MKIKLLREFTLFVLSISLVNTALPDDFCDGYEQGYKTDYKQATGSMIEPLVTLCPLEPLKKLK
ncbi:TPA: hypothetical protein ACT9A3_002972 [Legionella pneumophila]|nr:hypothetical protein [Legionella pneumophila]HAU0884345.1 hypothetical protein [Legionella pneumophila]HCD9579331.1 hypothetical protein [Legionella pneumophila]HDO7950371.1 hypothetical protein [Legionella pneumophila]HDO7953324.1 hypothetical protein [Legionella pneumophila]